ncbi:helix-turn-helix domain-containing protein [Pseudonocardia sp. TRM90224]|uniref:helix-turn-helix domain-containing protein n=1 Tax=Pseudonocardia sp. TRM90224 TaxID=2812678 RepID=UPI002104D995|nr:helix-turn-helix transcriptional regulator [Pseudonocardia sp. TRM90224]
MRRRLRVELRRMRGEADLTQRDVAAALDWSPSKVIRIESGQVGISVTDLRALLALYGLTDGDAVDELAGMARGSKRQPFSDYRDVLSAETIRFFGYEASASLIRHVQPLVVPGLLQTEDYTRALLHAYGTDAKSIDRIVESRRERQEALDRAEPPEVFTILDEAVLRRRVGGTAVMTRQLRHLEVLAERSKVTIQVVPFDHGAYEAIQGPFVHLEFQVPSDPDVVFVDNVRNAATFIDDVEITAQFQESFFALEDLAAPPGKFGRFVERAIGSFSESAE